MVRDSKGVLIHGFANSVHAGLVMAVETLAPLGCLKYLEEVLDRQVHSAKVVEVESHNLALVKCVMALTKAGGTPGLDRRMQIEADPS